MTVFLVVILVLSGVMIANFISTVKSNEANRLEQERKEELNDFLVTVRDMDPDIELEVLLKYKFNENLDEENNKKIDNRLIAFATNHSYSILKKITAYREFNRPENKEKIEYLENLLLETGFPTVLGMAKFYINNIDSDERRNYILEFLLKFKRINIIKFIDIVEEDLSKEYFDIFERDKKVLINFSEKNEN